MTKLVSLLVFLLFISFTSQDAINCNGAANGNVLDFDKMILEDDVDALSNDPQCATGNVCQIKCNSCRQPIFLLNFWNQIPQQDADLFGKTYLNKCVLQRSQSNEDLTMLKGYLAQTLQQVSSGEANQLINDCYNPNIRYSKILNSMLHFRDPLLKAISRTYQLMMTVEKVCSKEPNFLSNVQEAINEIFDLNMNAFMARFNNQFIADQLFKMVRQIGMSSSNPQYYPIQQDIINKFTQYIEAHSGDPVSPCDCTELLNQNYSPQLQQLISSTISSKCQEIC